MCPKRLIIAKRFHKRDQHLDETVSDYVAEIKNLTEYGEFGAMLEDSLRDRIICRLHNERIQEDLFTQEDLTFTNAVAKSVGKEMASKDRVELQEMCQMCTKCHILIVVHNLKHHKCHLELVR